MSGFSRSIAAIRRSGFSRYWHMRRVAGIAGGRRAALLENGIPFRARAQLHGVVESQRPAHVGAGGSLVAEA